ncbi:MlaC/ttg2D family ABC transporter substrate-binding protein [Pseudomonas saliphila]|uniref:MlaC/ttg2D family ABC transporter substrate-binding protein n=1 Tax=Pseudomonas saliphila TaxID=2586906 RepID=UPI0012390F1A|nr:ABC transporter substrate-binding protein [Pseudomonas saliphila]
MRNVIKLALVLALSVPLFAQAASATPQQVVEDTSNRVMDVLDSNRELYKKDSAAFLEGLSEVLDPVVDYEGIARSVMTVRFSRDASPEQVQRFIETFKRSMVQFYGNALLEFDSGEISVLPPRNRDKREDRASVNMEIKTANGTVYPATYTMVNKDGQWMVRNVIVEGINIGLLFRDQFAQAMQTHNNDLDKVIDNWGGVVAESREKVAKGEAQ